MNLYIRRRNGVIVEKRKISPGDRIASIAQPIARGIDKVFGTNVANCGGCKKMQHNLNNGMSFPQALRQRLQPNQETKTMIRINATITASDDNNIILETRGRQAGMKVIPRDDNAASALFAAIDAALEANKPPQRPQPVAAPAKPEAPAEPAAQ